MSGPCTVAIVDDVEDIRVMMRYWLDSSDDEFKVVGEAANGEEAVAVAREKQPHAMILDLSMPKMDGLQAIPEIRKCSPDTKIVVLSGFDADSMSLRAKAIGADAYLQKGSSFSTLTDLLREICS